MPRQILVWLPLLLIAVSSGVEGQINNQAKRSKKINVVDVAYTEPTSGVAMYKNYCAACHGSEGKGDGPAAEFLKVWPPDLGMLAQRNQGQYPAEHVVTTLRLRTPSHAHGTSDMPLWGELFRTVDANQSLGELRIKNLTNYIETLQRK